MADRQHDRTDDRREDHPKQLVKTGGDTVMVLTEERWLLRRSASSLPACLTNGGERAPQGRDRARRNSANILKVDKSYLDSKRRQFIRQTLPFPGRAPPPPRDAAKSKVDSGRVAAASVSAAVSAADLASSRATAASVAVASTGGNKHDSRSTKYSRSVTNLASVLRRPDNTRTQHKHRHRHHSEKSHKYIATTTTGALTRPPLHGGGGALPDTHARPLWRPMPQPPPPPPPDPVKPKSMATHGCSSCCAALNTAPYSSLLLLPLHLLLLIVLISYLIFGAFIFSKVSLCLQGVSMSPSRNTVTLPGTPRDPEMAAAREELVDRLLNTSLDLILDRSQEVVIAAIFTSSRMQNALRAFQQAGGRHLPSDGELDRLSRSVTIEWQQQLHNITARYHTLVTRHAHGFKVDAGERQLVWSSEEPPSPLPWTMWPSLLHVFCLVTTIGSSVHAQNLGGRMFAFYYMLLGIFLYLAVIMVWAARLSSTYSLIVKKCTRKKVDSQGGNTRASPYHSMQSRPPPAPHPYTLPRLVTLASILLVYVLSVGAYMVGGQDYWTGVENAIFVLFTIRPPIPLPQEATKVTTFIAFVMMGHVLLTLSLYTLKVGLMSSNNTKVLWEEYCTVLYAKYFAC
ncbi:hypothetical protein Hamer_G016647 [Homarus americanus]|uniref:Potassium channel domain-containing protein n=1 Tax=Homarus americanus TaxID=6706 RepID=A0A8J5MPZ9_HOMAM|nr:hypothetical protein Hamer_G016647 [Homarus americanus]